MKGYISFQQRHGLTTNVIGDHEQIIRSEDRHKVLETIFFAEPWRAQLTGDVVALLRPVRYAIYLDEPHRDDSW